MRITLAAILHGLIPAALSYNGGYSSHAAGSKPAFIKPLDTIWLSAPDQVGGGGV
jgi:hypothetical protein